MQIQQIQCALLVLVVLCVGGGGASRVDVGGALHTNPRPWLTDPVLRDDPEAAADALLVNEFQHHARDTMPDSVCKMLCPDTPQPLVCICTLAHANAHACGHVVDAHIAQPRNIVNARSPVLIG